MIQPIPTRWFPQKILPLTYDDSLSYYEFLCKILAKINEIIADERNKEMYDNLKKNIAGEYDKTEQYSENDYVWYNETLYKCKGATTGEFDESKWEVYRVADYLIWILEQISEMKNDDFWKVFRAIFTEYSNGNYNKGQIAFKKVNNHTVKIGVCKVSGVSSSFVDGDMWETETLDINTSNFSTGIIDVFYNRRIEANTTHNVNNFAKICSVLNSFAVWYDEPRTTPCLFKKYDLCWRVNADSMSEWYDDNSTYNDIELFYAKRNTNSGVEFSTDNWQKIIPDVSGTVGVNQVSLADYIKAMIDEYGGGTTVISPRQNVRNNVISEAE